MKGFQELHYCFSAGHYGETKKKEQTHKRRHDVITDVIRWCQFFVRWHISFIEIEGSFVVPFLKLSYTHMLTCCKINQVLRKYSMHGESNCLGLSEATLYSSEVVINATSKGGSRILPYEVVTLYTEVGG